MSTGDDVLGISDGYLPAGNMQQSIIWVWWGQWDPKDQKALEPHPVCCPWHWWTPTPDLWAWWVFWGGTTPSTLPPLITFALIQTARMLSWGSPLFSCCFLALVLAVLWSILKEWFLKIMSHDYIPLLAILHWPSPLNEIQVLYVDYHQIWLHLPLCSATVSSLYISLFPEHTGEDFPPKFFCSNQFILASYHTGKSKTTLLWNIS